MKYIKLFEDTNSHGEEHTVETAIFVSGDGSGYYIYCGTINPNEEENMNKVIYSRFKRFSFCSAKTIKPVDPYSGAGNMIWLNSWGHIMKYENNDRYVNISTYKFDHYYDLLDRFPDWKYELLPYFISDSKEEFIIDFFERIVDNNPYKKCWEDTDVKNVISYIKDCGVYNAYNKLKKYLLPIYKFAKYWGDDIDPNLLKTGEEMDDMGF